jgi:uncharacterized RDD family membrane protein YckC
MGDLDLDSRGGLVDSGPHQVVHSPEQVALHFPVAGPTSRMLAYAVDLIVILVIELSVFALFLAGSSFAAWLSELLSNALPGPSESQEQVLGALATLMMILLMIQVSFEMVYFVVLEIATGGRSIGKRLLGLRVVRDGGLPIGLRESLVRNLLRIADSLPANYLIGLVAMVVSPEGKRLGDAAAGTVVIRLDRPAAAAPIAELEGDTGAFRFDRGQIARLGADGRALARQTLRRVETLPPEEAEPLLERAVEALRARLVCEPVAPEERRRFLRALLAAGKR